jgi:hypothetical protein
MNQRSVSIKGTPRTIANACKKIFSSLEKFASSVDNVEKVAVKTHYFHILIGTNINR